MSLAAPTIPSGQPITLTGEFTDALPDEPTDGQLVVTDPTGAQTTYLFGSLVAGDAGVFSKLIAPIAVGRWTYVFHMTAGVLGVANGVFNVSPEDWTPSVADIGRKLRARTKDENGNELGEFTTATRPTAVEVAAIIEEETGALVGFVGDDLPIELWALARSAAVNRIAARIELEYWPEQVQAGRSTYEQLAAQRDTEEQRLVTAVRAMTGAGEAGGIGIGSMVTNSQVARDSGLIFSLDQVANGPDLAPTSPTPQGWPLPDPYWGGSPGTVV